MNDGEGDHLEVSNVVKMVYDCATRKFKPPQSGAPHTEYEAYQKKVEFFAWYWDKLLGTAAGASSWWRDSIRHNQVISQAKYKGLECVPVGSEAIVVLILENNKKRWTNTFKDSKFGTDKMWKLPRKKDHPDLHKYTQVYSSSVKGAKTYGGWSNAGRRRYNQLKNLVAAGRNQAHTAQLEEDVLARVRENNDLGDSLPDPEACYGKRRRTVPEEEMEDCD